MPLSRRGTVVLVGYQDKENLGLRYLAACLKRRNHLVRTVSFSAESMEVVNAVKEVQPDVVGFSLIFQNFAPDFARLISLLRRSGCSAHLTIGGHYPSFEYAQVLEAMPELDSVVRFEGEETLPSLLEAVTSGRPLPEIVGIAWRGPSGRIMVNPPRPGCRNLDSLPWPDRDDLDYAAERLSTASMIGSRGCNHTCAFCSITTFYKHNGTPGRRLRNPVDVADEMEMLHARGARVILFQDDDFLGGAKPGLAWAHSVAAECLRRNLHKTLRWRISCRSDEVRQEVFAPLVKAGLSHVYLGVESGDSQHLLDLNKKLVPEMHLSARDTLQAFNLSFDFGFMLLTPWSTFETARSNLNFLREFVGDGEAPAGFCRTLPYAGTTIADRLRREGRLLPGFRAEYCFRDPRLDALHTWLYQVFNTRNNDPHGTRNLLSLLLFEASLDLPGHPRNPLHGTILQALASVSNTVMIDTVEAALDYFQSLAAPPRPDDSFLGKLQAHHEGQDLRIREDIKRWCSARLEAIPENATSVIG